MSTIRLNFRELDTFNQIKSGAKTVETRALNPDEPERYFGNIKKGDKLELKSVDTGEVLVRLVKDARSYEKFQDYLNTEDFKKIFCRAITKAEVRDIHFSFPGYKERLEKYGIVAFELK